MALPDVDADEWAAAIDTLALAERAAEKLTALQTALAKRIAHLQAAQTTTAAPADAPAPDAASPAADPAPVHDHPEPATPAEPTAAAPAAPATDTAPVLPAETSAAPVGTASAPAPSPRNSARKVTDPSKAAGAEPALAPTPAPAPAPASLPAPASPTAVSATEPSPRAAAAAPAANAAAPQAPVVVVSEEKKEEGKRADGWTAARPVVAAADTSGGGPKKGARFVCIETYTGAGPEELTFSKGDAMLFWEADESGWAYGEVDGRRGWFPFSYVATPEIAAPLLAAAFAEPPAATAAAATVAPTATAAPTASPSPSPSASSPIAAAAAAHAPAAAPAAPVASHAAPAPAAAHSTGHATAHATVPLSTAPPPVAVETASIVANKNVISNKLGNFLGGKRADKKSLEEKHILPDLSASQASVAKKEKRDMLTNFFKSSPTPDEKAKKKGKGDEELPPAFGQALEKLLQKPDKKSARSGKGLALSYIPAVVSDCIKFLDRPERLSLEGLFRLSPSRDDFDRLRALWHSMAEPLDLDQHTQDPHAVAAVLKSFFNALPEPVLTFALSEQIFAMKNLEKVDVAELKALINKLPILNKMTIECLFVFLRRVIEFSDKNRMTASNVAIVWGPNLVRARNETPEMLLSRQDTLFVERILAHSKEIFGHK